MARAVGASEQTLGLIESGLSFAGLAANRPGVAIGTIFQASPLSQISLTKKGIMTPADWVGRVITVGRDGHEAIDAVLAKTGMTRAQFTVVEADYGNVPLLDGRYDSMQVYLIDEFEALKTEGHDVSAILLGEYGSVTYSQVIIVSREFLEKEPRCAREISRGEQPRLARYDRPSTKRTLLGPAEIAAALAKLPGWKAGDGWARPPC